jgi:antitoxin component YwqK of YwqJK toxin-antitoxin module
MMIKKTVPDKKSEMIDGETIKYHANGKTRWSKGKIVDGKTEGYWEWYRIDGTLKRSGYFHLGEPVGEWTTYDEKEQVYKVTKKE